MHGIPAAYALTSVPTDHPLYKFLRQHTIGTLNMHEMLFSSGGVMADLGNPLLPTRNQMGDMLSSATKIRSEEVREFLHIPEYVTGLYEPSHAQYAMKMAYYTRIILECFEESLTTFMDQYFDTHLKNNTDAETFLRQVHRFMYPQFAFQLPDRARWRKFLQETIAVGIAHSVEHLLVSSKLAQFEKEGKMHSAYWIPYRIRFPPPRYPGDNERVLPVRFNYVVDRWQQYYFTVNPFVTGIKRDVVAYNLPLMIETNVRMLSRVREVVKKIENETGMGFLLSLSIET
jgi:hypothetical protein